MNCIIYCNGIFKVIPPDISSEEFIKQYDEILSLYVTDEKKFVRIMNDYFATSLWNYDGFNEEYENYSLSKETIALLKVMEVWYDEWSDTFGDEFKHHETYSALAEIAFKRVISELPDYVIVLQID